MFGRSRGTIQDAFKLRAVTIVDKKNKPISIEDIKYTEEKLGYKLPFKINRSKLSKELQNTVIEDVIINQFNLTKLPGLKNIKNQINNEMQNKYFSKGRELVYFVNPLQQVQLQQVQLQVPDELQKFKFDLEQSELIAKKIISIKFHSREKGYDLYTEDYHNFFLSNGVLSHNSTCCLQVAYFIAWSIAGGSMAKEESTGRWFVSAKPSKKVRFTIEDNVVFTPDDLQVKARELFTRYGKNQVIVYDEGRAGLDSAAAMTAINKGMADFFQECGQYGHVILIVLPNFFKLHEDYAISRSIFLIDVFTNKRMERGYFNFYNEAQKEALYINGRKKTGTMSKYSGARPSFTGRFSSFLPIDKDKYEAAKQEAIKQKEVKNIEKKWKRQRDAALLMLYKHMGVSPDDIAQELTALSQVHIDGNMVRFGIRAITGKQLSEIK
jgi:hypothetical protein